MKVYKLPGLTQEQLAVTFAMCSRSPEPFDIIAKKVSETKAAEFNEKWVLNYGHSSVAEHGVLQLAVEGISRLAADKLEDSRLASFTEKSSRYQVINSSDYYIPDSALKEDTENILNIVFNNYNALVKIVTSDLKKFKGLLNNESDSSFLLRMRRISTDICRALLPAATLTNLGMTINAREMEHCISKLLSSDIPEVRLLANNIKKKSLEICPTLVKYANYNEYIHSLNGLGFYTSPNEASNNIIVKLFNNNYTESYILEILNKGLQYNLTGTEWNNISYIDNNYVTDIIQRCSVYDSLPRIFEAIHFNFEINLDYGAYREFKRHRMMSIISQPLTIKHGFNIPNNLMEDSSYKIFNDSIKLLENLWVKYYDIYGIELAQYFISHSHIQRIFVDINLREVIHFLRLRCSQQAHQSIRMVAEEMRNILTLQYPIIFNNIHFR